MSRLTEADVFLHNEHIIRETSYIYGKGLEPEDCLMVANEGFLYAIRCYQKGISEFQPYAKTCMYKHINNAKKELNRIKRIESKLSLDQPIKAEENSETIGNVFFQVSGDFVNSVLLRDFLDSLEDELKIIAWMCIDQYTSEEIMKTRNISKVKLAHHKKMIRELFLQYDQLI